MRYTVKQFNTEYPDDEACLRKVFLDRYGEKPTCPHCQRESKFYLVTGRKCFACEFCGGQFHPLADTIFHKSSTSLKDWFYAIYLFAMSKNGVSAKELERQIGVTYKTAHRMAMQIRKLMEQPEDDPLDGEIEVDETYIGGRHLSRERHSSKSIVFGMVERKGRAHIKHVKSNGSRALIPEIINNAFVGSTFYSDEWRAYKVLGKTNLFQHETVKHRIGEYVRDNIHTNTIEGVWSQLKRSIDGT
ncbi:MAG: IS1595 family transposase, partial [Candidatus Saccharimonadales bacterium]